MGLCYKYGIGVKKNPELAFKYYKLSAEQENVYGQYGLGYCYENGFGTEKDINLAVKYYSLSANQESKLAIDALKRLAETK